MTTGSQRLTCQMFEPAVLEAAVLQYCLPRVRYNLSPISSHSRVIPTQRLIESSSDRKPNIDVELDDLSVGQDR